MFGTLRSLAARAKTLFTKARTLGAAPSASLAYPATKYNGPAVPVVTRRRQAALRVAAALEQHPDHPHHYPELSCRSGKPKGKRDRSPKQRGNRRKAAARAALFVFAALVLQAHGHSQTVTVHASRLMDGDTPANGTITFSPVLSNGQAASYHHPSGGQSTITPFTVKVTSGVFSLTLPDTGLTTPKNLCFSVLLSGTRNPLGKGYSCLQPSANNSWCAAGDCNFDNFTPNAQAIPISDFDKFGAASTVQAASLQKSGNLADVPSPATARANLGLGSAATQPTTAFDAAGAATAAQAAEAARATAAENTRHPLMPGVASDGATGMTVAGGVSTASMNGLLSTALSAQADRRTFTNVVISQGSATLTSSDAAFTPADTGKIVTVPIGPQGIKAGTYSAGATVTGIAGQTCVLSGFDGGGVGADAYLTLTGVNTISPGAALTYTQYGSGYTNLPTTATLSSGSATCSGTVTLTGGSYYVWPVTTVLTYVSPTSVTLGATATTAANGSVGGSIGTDNTPLIQAQVTASRGTRTCVTIPPGSYMLGSPIIVTGNECIHGANGFAASNGGGTNLYPAAGSAAVATPDPSTSGYPQVQYITIKDLFIFGGQNGLDLGLSHLLNIENISCTDQSGWCISHIRGERHRVDNIQCYHNRTGQGCISLSDATNSIYANTYASAVRATITNVAVASNVATITITSNTLFPEPTQTITISGLANTFLNGTWTVTAGTATSFTFSVAHADLTATADSGTATYAWNDIWWDKSIIERVSDMGPDNYTIWSNAGAPGTHPGSVSGTRMNYIKGISYVAGTASKSLVRLWSVIQSNFSDLGIDNVHASGAAVFDVNGYFNYSTVRNLVTVGPGNYYANGAYFHNDFQGSGISNCYVGGDNSSFVGLHFGTTTSMNGSVRDCRASIKVEASNAVTGNHINVEGGLIAATTGTGTIHFSEQTNNNISFLLAADQTGTAAATSDFEVNVGASLGTVRKQFAVNAHGPTAPQGVFNFAPIASNSSPLNGDCWTTSAGLFCYINGSTVGPYTAAGCTNNCSFTGTTNLAGLSVSATAALASASTLSWNSDLYLGRITGGGLTVGSTSGAVDGQVRAAQFRLANSGNLNTIQTDALTASRIIYAPNGDSSPVLWAALVTTATTSDNVTIQGMTAGGHCSLTPTNAAAATNLATTYVSAKTANQITVIHATVASMNYDVMCTSH
jgi:hypothetical protein